MRKLLSLLPALVVALSVGAAEIPILGWHGMPPEMVSAARYAEARDMGMTIINQGSPDIETARRFLDLAQSVGLKLCIGVKELAEEETCASVALALKDHPALAMYYIGDEPTIPKFPKVGRIVKALSEADPGHPAYVNLISCVMANPARWYGGVERYPDYLQAFFEEVPAKILSIDAYPIIAKERFPEGAPLRTCPAGYSVKTNWFETLEAALPLCREHGVPLYAFANCCAHSMSLYDYAETQVQHLMLQHNVNLAYGAQLLQYYSYWPFSPNTRMRNQSQTFTNGEPFLRTSIYDRVREANRRVQARAPVFVGGEVVRVRHTGEEIPVATTRLAPDDLPAWVASLETPDGGAVVSIIRNRGREFLVVVNRSVERELTLKVALAPGTKRIREDGSVVDAARYSGEYWLEPGAMEVFVNAPAPKGATAAFQQ